MLAISQLEAAAARSTVIMKSVEQARLSGRKSAFLCHSHRDKILAEGLQAILRDHGCELYLDWQDAELPAQPDRTTAERIQKKIREADYFLFLATANSTASRWCPWEIGYADSARGTERVIIVPTVDKTGTWHGNEYLRLYRHINDAKGGGLGVFSPSGQGIFVKSL